MIFLVCGLSSFHLPFFAPLYEIMAWDIASEVTACIGDVSSLSVGHISSSGYTCEECGQDLLPRTWRRGFFIRSVVWVVELIAKGIKIRRQCYGMFYRREESIYWIAKGWGGEDGAVVVVETVPSLDTDSAMRKVGKLVGVGRASAKYKEHNTYLK